MIYILIIFLNNISLDICVNFQLNLVIILQLMLYKCVVYLTKLNQIVSNTCD